MQLGGDNAPRAIVEGVVPQLNELKIWNLFYTGNEESELNLTYQMRQILNRSTDEKK